MTLTIKLYLTQQVNCSPPADDVVAHACDNCKRSPLCTPNVHPPGPNNIKVCVVKVFFKMIMVICIAFFHLQGSQSSNFTLTPHSVTDDTVSGETWGFSFLLNTFLLSTVETNRTKC